MYCIPSLSTLNSGICPSSESILLSIKPFRALLPKCITFLYFLSPKIFSSDNSQLHHNKNSSFAFTGGHKTIRLAEATVCSVSSDLWGIEVTASAVISSVVQWSCSFSFVMSFCSCYMCLNFYPLPKSSIPFNQSSSSWYSVLPFNHLKWQPETLSPFCLVLILPSAPRPFLM